MAYITSYRDGGVLYYYAQVDCMNQHIKTSKRRFRRRDDATKYADRLQKRIIRRWVKLVGTI